MGCPATALQEAEVTEALKSLPGWQLKDNALERTYDGGTYLDSLDRLTAVAKMSEEANHHPDLALYWKKLVIRFWTHTANGITQFDIELAQKTEQLLS